MGLAQNKALPLFCATFLAFLFANSPLSSLYEAIGTISSPSPLFLVNDGLMTLFFLVVGLEIRREILSGELNSFAKSALPGLAALGGMLVPALIYLVFTYTDPVASRGYGIPVATDIAFALGVLALLGSRVPKSLKAFLTALAIFDDIGAILLIALFYSHQLQMFWLLVCLITALGMWVFQKLRVASLLPYLLLAAAMWWACLQSGIHPTIAGVVVAFLLPMKNNEAMWLKHKLEPFVDYAVLPLFAFLNAGVALSMSLADLLNPVSLGIIFGLFFGKLVGVFSFTWVCVKVKFAPKPRGTSWAQIFGVAALCGIGFTMSLFVGMLAFEGQQVAYQAWLRTGVLVGSLLSATTGYLIIRFGKKGALRDAS